MPGGKEYIPSIFKDSLQATSPISCREKNCFDFVMDLTIDTVSSRCNVYTAECVTGFIEYNLYTDSAQIQQVPSQTLFCVLNGFGQLILTKTWKLPMQVHCDL